MLNTLLTRVVGTRNERELKRIRPMVAQVGAFEPEIQKLSDAALAAKTVEFRERLGRGQALDDLLPEAFAVVREAGWRVLNMRHFDVQLIGGLVLHRGMIAEMKTGEGKTLVATLAAYLNALPGKGVHVVTVNDYLAKRDSEWMGRLYRFLGLSVGVIQHSMDDQERQLAYAADITYGTNNEFGFDYLRDNMKFDLGMYVQRGHNFAVVDEVDSILIDEARTPLIISGPAEESTDKYYRIDQVIPKLKPGARITGDKKAEERAELEKTGDYIVDEKAKTVTLTEMGMAHAEKLLGVKNLWEPTNMDVLHHVNQGLRAHTLFHRDVDYVVKDGQVTIVDEFTGRLMPGRRWSDGLHQAVEAKEKVKIERENQTLATITFQNYFRMYGKLSGMTGTAETEAPEFDKIYKLEVLVIPTNRPLIRVENPDVVFRTEREKFGSVEHEIEELHKSGRPVLVGTISIEKSEELSTLLKKANIKHVVLNAKYHEREAEIVAQAGRFGAVTIATNMAGRGTDIILGGVPDHRVKAVLQEKQVGGEPEGPAMVQAAVEEVQGEMAGEFRRELQHRKLTPEARQDLARRYLGLMASFSPDHPSVITVRAHAPAGSALAGYLDGARELPRVTKERISKAFYPEIENPVDFLSVHPMKAALDAVAGSVELGPVEALLEANERERVVALGGLHILGTERHEARRIDNQLRGRAGRQGDPGSSRFYLSLEDDLMRIFAGEWVKSILTRLGMKEGEAIESHMVSRRIEGAQKKVEERNFDIRKNLLEYDEVMDEQRKRVYGYRQNILNGANCKQLILEMIHQQIEHYLDQFLDKDYGTETFAGWASKQLSVELDARDFRGSDFSSAEMLARDQAERAAEGQVLEALEENLPAEEEPSEWNWEALAKFVNTRWHLSLRDRDLRQLGRDQVGDFLIERARAAVQKIDLSEGERFLRPDFNVQTACNWVRHKFGIELAPGEVGALEPAAFKALVCQKAEAAYEEKEYAYPVMAGLYHFTMRDAMGHKRYDRDALAQWARDRFEVELSIEDLKNKQREEIRQTLVDRSREFSAGMGPAMAEALAWLERILDPELPEDRSLRRAYDDERLKSLCEWLAEKYHYEMSPDEIVRCDAERVRRHLTAAVEDRYRPEMRKMERALVLQLLDAAWKDHLLSMDHLRSSVGLRGYAQIDPKVEYKREGMKIFEAMWTSVGERVTDLIYRMEQLDESFVGSTWSEAEAIHQDAQSAGEIAAQQQAAIDGTEVDHKPQPIRNRQQRVGRNDPCPCGSGKKFKQCCMRKG